MTNKLQSMMQSHCSEALRLLQIGSLNVTTASRLDFKQVRTLNKLAKKKKNQIEKINK